MDGHQLTSKIIGAAIEAHKNLGPGLLESTYEECQCYELTQNKKNYERQKEIPVCYKNNDLDCGYRIDVLVENAIVLELKAVTNIEPIHKAQTLTYLKLSNMQLGLLLNFNVPLMKEGIQRIVNNLDECQDSN